MESLLSFTLINYDGIRIISERAVVFAFPVHLHHHPVVDQKVHPGDGAVEPMRGAESVLEINLPLQLHGPDLRMPSLRREQLGAGQGLIRRLRQRGRVREGGASEGDAFEWAQSLEIARQPLSVLSRRGGSTQQAVEHDQSFLPPVITGNVCG